MLSEHDLNSYLLTLVLVTSTIVLLRVVRLWSVKAATSIDNNT